MNKYKEMRKKTGLKQYELANLIDVKISTYSSYERGIREPKIDVLLKLANFYHMPITELIGYEFDSVAYENVPIKLKKGKQMTTGNRVADGLEQHLSDESKWEVNHGKILDIEEQIDVLEDQRSEIECEIQELRDKKQELEREI